MGTFLKKFHAVDYQILGRIPSGFHAAIIDFSISSETDAHDLVASLSPLLESI